MAPRNRNERPRYVQVRLRTILPKSMDVECDSNGDTVALN